MKHDHSHNHSDGHNHDHSGHDHKGHNHKGHSHGGSHAGHNHGPVNYNKAFAIGITLNLVFVAVEGAYGYFANSLALLADAGHNLSDVLGLVLAWVAAWLATRKPSARYTYGFKSYSILAALANALLLLVAVGGILWEAWDRFEHPSPVASGTVMIVAGIGIVINGITAMLFMSGSKSDLNIKGAYLHMLADALVSLGVVIAGAIIYFTGWASIDSIVSIVIGIVILISTWGLFKESLKLSAAAVPAGIDPEKVLEHLKKLPGVTSVHDLHIWGMSTSEAAMTGYIVIPGGHPGDSFLLSVTKALKEKFNIQHSTIQIEVSDTTESCELSVEGAF